MNRPEWRYKEIIKRHVSIRESALHFITECSRATPDLYRPIAAMKLSIAYDIDISDAIAVVSEMDT